MFDEIELKIRLNSILKLEIIYQLLIEENISETRADLLSKFILASQDYFLDELKPLGLFVYPMYTDIGSTPSIRKLQAISLSKFLIEVKNILNDIIAQFQTIGTITGGN